ncbi:MAG: T9SS type A sorting domain-containing protein [Phycisphaerae bacterium]|nr:T9SS type A sorting domain-containing protein [Saprospiraceae bacterium]
MLNKLLLAALVSLSALSATAQAAHLQRIKNRPSIPNSQLRSLPASSPRTGLEPAFATAPSSVVVPPAPHTVFRDGQLVEEETGPTQYDLQSNGTEQARLHVWPDGNVSTVWVMSNSDETTGYTDRGSGYNQRSQWLGSNYPAGRLETVRTGFSNYVVTENGTEFISSHRNKNLVTADGKFVLRSLRRPAGQTTWTESDLPSVDANGQLWSKLAVDGNTIHLLALSTPVGPTPTFTGAVYKGLNGHPLYWRSKDAGATWDIIGGVIPGLDSTKYAELSSDDYAISARDGVVAVGIFNSFNDCKIFKSSDGGDTWPDSYTIWDFPLEKYKIDKGYTVDDLGGADPNAPSPLSVFTVDGNGSLAVDAAGFVHAWVGEMYVLDSILTDATSNYYPGVNGLLYWSEIKPEELFEIAYSDDWNGNGVLDFTSGSIVGYGCGLSSQPAGAVSDNGEIYVAYSAAVENLYDTDQGLNFRHLYIVRSLDYGETWEWPPLDVQYATDPEPDSLISKLTEGVWPSCYKKIDDKFHVVYQRDYSPGSTAQLTGVQAGHDSRWVYLARPTVGTKEPLNTLELSFTPNPANDFTQIAFNLAQKAASTVEVFNLSGSMVVQKSLGSLGSGPQFATLNVASLQNGLYFVKIHAGSHTGVAKMLVMH